MITDLIDKLQHLVNVELLKSFNLRIIMKDKKTQDQLTLVFPDETELSIISNAEKESWLELNEDTY